MKRKEVNNRIRHNVNEYWNELEREILKKKIRKAIFSQIGLFEEQQESNIQDWAHRMIPHESLATHADRLDLKRALRRYMRQQTIAVLGLQAYFPELFTMDDKPKDAPICIYCKSTDIKKQDNGTYKCLRCRQEFQEKKEDNGSIGIDKEN